MADLLLINSLGSRLDQSWLIEFLFFFLKIKILTCVKYIIKSIRRAPFSNYSNLDLIPRHFKKK